MKDDCDEEYAEPSEMKGVLVEHATVKAKL
jgi:hypothetical protein